MNSPLPAPAPPGSPSRPVRLGFLSFLWHYRWRWLPIFMLFLLLIGIRYARVYAIPDVGSPFDVVAFLAENEIPPEENAYRYYDQITQRLNTEEYRLPANPWFTLITSKTLGGARSWGDLSPSEQKAVRQLHPIHDLFLQGAQLERGYQHSLKSMGIDSLLPFAQNSRGLVVLAKCEAFRREDQNDEAGTWECLRGALRLTRHLTRGCEIEFLVAFANLKSLEVPIWDWLLDERRSPQLLRQALKDLQWAVANTPPLSRQVKYNYVLAENVLTNLRSQFAKLEHPVGMNIGTNNLPKYLQAPWRKFVLTGLQILGEPERAERLARQICKNRLSACDLPLQERLKRIPAGSPPINPFFTVPAGDSKLLSPTQLYAVCRSEMLPANNSWNMLYLTKRDEEQILLRSLVLTAALQIFRRETGHYPEKLSELAPKVLETLPEDPTADKGQPFQYRRLKNDECQLWTSVGSGPDAAIPAALKQTQGDFKIYEGGGLVCLLRPKKSSRATDPVK